MAQQHGAEDAVQVSYTAPVSHYADRYIYVRVKVNGKQVKPILVKWLGSEQRFTK